MINSDQLEKTFNLAPLVIEGEIVSETSAVPAVPVIEKGKLEDSDFIRKNLKELAESTKDALDLALQIQSDDPNSKNTEAVAKMADAVSKALSSLITLNKTERDEEHRAKPSAPTVVNQHLTVMTTEEIIAKIINQTKQLKEK